MNVDVRFAPRAEGVEVEIEKSIAFGVSTSAAGTK